MIKVKVSRSEKLKIENQEVPVHFSVGKAGKEIVLTEKEANYVRETEKRYLKAQGILKNAYERE